MKIIGAGFGRTGTMSLAAALEQLGFSPCYHMLETFKKPAHIKTWQAAADGEPVDWKSFLGGYQAGVDYPLVAFYKELTATFPEAKVILTVRDAQSWYESTMQTIFQGTIIPDWFLRWMPGFRGMRRMLQATTWDRIFHGKFEDKDYAIGIFEQHIEEVKRSVPADKLLIFNVRDGWEPLCRFLEVPTPEGSFPHINERSFTRRGYLLARIAAPAVAILLLIAFALVLRALL